MRHLVFLLEERSAGELLRGLLPRLLPGAREEEHFFLVTFEGKSDLEQSLAGYLRGWNKPGARFVVLRDQDSSDCRIVKQRILGLCKMESKGDVLVRIACHCLEAWYLGDLSAVDAALCKKNFSSLQGHKKYRNPDALGNANQEYFRLTESSGKVKTARLMGKRLSLSTNTSHSFRCFVDGVARLWEKS
jgi:hypothetical protein